MVEIFFLFANLTRDSSVSASNERSVVHETKSQEDLYRYACALANTHLLYLPTLNTTSSPNAILGKFI